jgi:ATP-dependent Lon protease
MGRSDDEIAEMKSRIEEELSEVLTHNERKNFYLDKALKRINKAMGD